MRKKYVVRLTEAERARCRQIIRSGKGGDQKIRRARILLKADVAGPAWTDLEIAKAYGCRTKTVENIRKRFVEDGFELTLEGKKRLVRKKKKVLSGKVIKKLIALHKGRPPKGHSHWSLRLLADTLVERKVVPSISHETVRRVLKEYGLSE
jgi:transposase